MTLLPRRKGHTHWSMGAEQRCTPYRYKRTLASDSCQSTPTVRSVCGTDAGNSERVTHSLCQQTRCRPDSVRAMRHLARGTIVGARIPSVQDTASKTNPNDSFPLSLPATAQQKAFRPIEKNSAKEKATSENSKKLLPVACRVLRSAQGDSAAPQGRCGLHKSNSARSKHADLLRDQAGCG